MPMRNRQHELEDESELALRNSIGPSWIFRDIGRHDYGIDGSLERFQDGDPSGVVLNLQLKATDDPDDGTGSSVRLKVSTCEYWNRLELPTLVVSFHAASGNLYARFWHEHPYERTATQKTITFHFAAEHLWSSSTPDALVDAVRAFHRVRAAGVQMPLQVHVVTETDTLFDRPVGASIGVIRSAAGRVPRLVAISLDPPPSGGASITLTRDRTSVFMGAGARTTIAHVEAGFHSLGFEVLVGLAMGLARIGLPAPAAALLEVALPSSSYGGHPEVLVFAGEIFKSAQRLSDGVALGTDLLDSWPAESVVPLATQMSADIEGAGSRDVVAVAELVAKCAEGVSDDVVGRDLWLEVARTLRTAKPPDSLAAFYKAADRDPAERDTWRWNALVGGAAHDAGDHSTAIAAYQRSLEIEPDNEIRAQLADSLLAAGQIAEANEAFERYISDGGTERKWIPSIRLADRLHVRGAVDWSSALRLLGSDPTTSDLAEDQNEVPEYIVLSGQLFNSGLAALANERPEDALLSFLGAVQVWPHDAEAWVQASVCAFNMKLIELFAIIAERAYIAQGYAFLDQARIMFDQLDPIVGGGFLDILESVVRGDAFGSGETEAT